jgi:hypothetical protein
MMRRHWAAKSLTYILSFQLLLICPHSTSADSPTTAPSVTSLPKVGILPTAPCKLFTAQVGATVLLQTDAKITSLAPELIGLSAIQIPQSGGPITLTSRAPVQLLIGYFHGPEPQFAPPPPATPAIKNAATITNMPPLDVYLINFKKGKTTLTFPGTCVILGVIPTAVTIPPHDAAGDQK